MQNFTSIIDLILIAILAAKIFFLNSIFLKSKMMHKLVSKRVMGVERSFVNAKSAFSHWASIPLAPPDKILGLNDSFKTDASPVKVNLGVGAYRDAQGKPYVLPSVRAAEALVLKKNMDHEYAGIAGIQSYIDTSIEFAYGSDSAALKEGRVAAIQALSGTGACRLVGEFISRFFGAGTPIYLPDPTWGNHLNIFKDAGLETRKYRYFDPDTCGVDFKGMVEDMTNAANGSAFLIHACAHNPTGCDPSTDQWAQLSTLAKEKDHKIFFDCAYQGFASGCAETDAYALRTFVADGHKVMLAQSFAKNFGLYGERIGTVSVVTASAEEKERVLSQLKALARPMYSNPPIYGARLVAEILSDPSLRLQWTKECKEMADRIISMRSLLREAIEGLGSNRNWQHITEQIGMFCFTGLSKDEVLRMRTDFAIYCTEDGRISMAGVTTETVPHIAKAIHTVTA